MNRGALLLLALLPAIGCRERGLETGQRAPSRYTASGDSARDQGGIEGTHTGIQFEAPRLIPAVETQLQQVTRSRDKANLSAYRGGASALVDAMEGDVRRAGLSDTGGFYRLSDSVVRELGGGAGGLAKGPPPNQLQAHVDRMQRLIESYLRMMQSAR